ncbi:hypothetical protein NEMBOFW57_007155 [Staphylotrichum longicolle]|uniref:Uncharacterized protein n=1 Tax=Staphylotrichum longicolle TaxID=669026 RepID=A0AAD4HX63_9PEZI|nr:hypothetical protein NEMBOFW57_007155 [Staphylotrichum longicolle]
MERRMWVRRLWNTAVKTNMARSPTETKAPREDNTKNLVANRATAPASTSIIRVTRSLQDPPRRINGIGIDALPDTGAEASFISESFLRKLHLDGKEGYDKDAPIWSLEYHVPISPPVQLASGKTVTPTTMALIPWRFEGESQVHKLACLVLPQCAHDLILGDAFLRATETLTKFKTRIVMTLRSLGSRLLRLNYMGSGLESISERRRMWGSLDGEAVAALPDSGSDIMAVSAEYARRRGWKVDRGRKRRVEVEFADGSAAWTKGVVSGLEWEFGGAGGKVRSDFYVLEDLPVDVVFSSDFVFDHDVYGRHEQSIRRYGELLDVLRLCNIRLIGECKKQEQAEEEGIVDSKWIVVE